MPIRVTCPGCLKKFQVSEQFAGKQGPCPSCKKEITIPDPKKDKVVVHAPEVGPKDSIGQSVLKPLARTESTFSTIQILLIIAAVVIYLIVALGIRIATGANVENPLEYPIAILAFGAVMLGPPMALAGYFFLKNEELGSFRGKELWIRVTACGLLFAVLWLAPFLTTFAFQNKYTTVPLVLAVSIMFAIGGVVAAGSFELDYLIGLVLFGLYFGTCVLMRIIVNAQALPLEPS